MTKASLTRLQLNELELIYAGAYGAARHYVLPGAPGHVATLRAGNGVAVGDELHLLDTEGTPVASVAVESTRADGDRTWVEGPVRRLRDPSVPPFAELRPSGVPGELTDRATLVIGADVPQRIEGLVLVVDEGDPHTLTQAVLRAKRTGAEVRVLPAPEAAHVPADGRSALLEHLASVLFAQEVTTVDHGVRPKGDGIVILFTGLSGSGKSTVARELTRRLRAEGTQRVTLLDGDEVRDMLSRGLGFSRPERELNVRRIGWVAALVASYGGIAICAPIAPYESMRAEVRQLAERSGRFLLVHLATPLDVCEVRDRKGLYAKARAGELQGFTGISDPYEVPVDADVVLDTSVLGVQACVDAIDDAIHHRTVAQYTI